MPGRCRNNRYHVMYAKMNPITGKLEVFEEDFSSTKDIQSKSHIPRAGDLTRERLRRLIQWRDAEGVWHSGAKEKMRREFSHMVITRNPPV